MAKFSRKQREIQEREQQILSLARGILLAEGYNGLTMDRLAGEMEYAKGTLYKHFPNKEEIVAALALQSMELRRRLFEFAAMIRANTRYRLAAIGGACDFFAAECREHFAMEQMLRNGAILEKSSEIRQSLVRQCEHRVMAIVAGVVRDAVASSDLDLPPGLSPEEFVFGFWSLMFGSQILVATSPAMSEIGVEEPTRTIRFHAWTLMNAYNWKPFYSFEETEQQLEDVRKRLLSEVER
jgi:AcrR family transcriptional regulator